MHRLIRLVVTGAVTAVAVAGVVPPAMAAAPPPATITVVRAGDTQVQVSWHNPTSSTDFVKARLFYSPVAAPATVSDGTEVPLSQWKATTGVATGLTNGTTYFFTVFTTDGHGHLTPSASAHATPTVPGAGHFTVSLSRGDIGPALGTSSAVLTGVYTDATGKVVAGLPVQVQQRVAGTTTWSRLATERTGSLGRLRITLDPKRTDYYRLFLPASPFDAATTSSSVRLRYHPTVSLSAPALVRTYTAFAVSGVSNARAAGQLVVLKRYYSGAWHTIGSTRTGTYGGYRFTRTPTNTDPWTLRVIYAATVQHTTAASATRKLTVVPRDLSSGMSGPDVLALQRRLRALHYDVGGVDGNFGYNTLHAVIPFQKFNGLPRTGVVDATTLRRLASPKVPVRRHLVAGHSVEVDLTHQIAAFYQDGKLYRIVDVSTGSGQTYWENGVQEVANTPVGSFQVQWKVDGLRISPLGELWKPSFFYGGYAIHGEGLVPPYPASHGCVRITNPAADRYFDWLTIGTKVYIFN